MAFGMKKKGKDDDNIKKLVEKIQQMYKVSYNDKSSEHTEWDNYYKAYTGEYFQKKLPSYKNQTVENFVFSTIETVKPVILSENPKILALPQVPEMYDKADAVQKALDYEWSRTKMMRHAGGVITNSLIFGTGILGVLWDNSDQNGLGNVLPVVISPFNFFVDPAATSMDDAEWAIYATYKTLGEVSKFVPDMKEELKNSLSMPSDSWLNYNKPESSDSNVNQKLLYIEAYFKDETTVLEEITDEDGQVYKVEKLKYPNGRRVIIAGDVLISDGENPYKDGKFPFTIYKCYDIPGEFWGMGEVQQIMSPTNTINVLTNSLVETAELTANPIWIADKNCGVTKGSLTNRKGLVVRKNPGTEVKREAPPTMPAYIQAIIDNMKADVENISGVYDVTRGEKPTGITAAAAIQALNEQAQGRIKLKVQNFEMFLSETGGLWLSRIQQFWVTTRTIRVMKADYKAEFEQFSGDEVDGDFDIIIVAGSTMPINKTSRLQQMIQLAQTQAEDGLPCIDRQAILENSDLPGMQTILQRFAQTKEQQSKSQQQAAQEQFQQQLQLIQAKAQADMMTKQQDAQNQLGLDQQRMSMQNGQQMEQIKAQHQQELANQQQNSFAKQDVADLISNIPPDVLMQIAESNPRMLEILNQVSNNQTAQAQNPVA